MNTANSHQLRRSAAVLLTGTIGIAIGYLIGIKSPEPWEDPRRLSTRSPDVLAPSPDVLASDADLVGSASTAMPAADYSHMRRARDFVAVPQGDHARPADWSPEALASDAALVASASTAMPAADYSHMRRRETGPTSKWEPTLERIQSVYDYHRCVTCHNPHSAEIRPNEQDKQESLKTRAGRRAFNGAPPVIPHAVEQTDDAACFACHGQGARVGQRVANRMSHGLLVNCLQCHAVPPPKSLAQFEVEVANTFVGLPAPTSGQRAFPGAPPVIPHSTWMRENCLSCHGGAIGWRGLEVTHRWRTNCQQCHATSAQLEQANVADTVDFVSEYHTQQP